ncbi:MAG: phosphatase PAP2 family protein [Lapillicoccus sp.]
MLPKDRPDDEHIGTRDLASWPTGFGRWLVRLGLRVATWTTAHGVLVLTAAVGLVIAVTATWATGEVYESITEAGPLAALDQRALDLAVSWRSPGLDTAVTHFTDVGGPVGMPILALVATVIMTVAWRSRTPVILMVIAAIGSLAMTTVGKDLVGRARPPLSLAVPPYETSPSFPSGHTLNAVVITGIVVYLVLRRLVHTLARAAVLAAGVVFAVAMSLSRVYLGHHWLTDVLAGWLLGLGWLAAVITAHRLFLTVQRSHADRRTPATTAP